MVMRKISYILLICGLLACVMPAGMKAETVQERVQYLIDHANDATAGGVYDLSELVAPDLFTKQSGNIGLTTTSDNFTIKRIWAYEQEINRNAYTQPFSFSRTLTNMPKGNYAYGMKYFSSYYVAGSRTTRYGRESTLNADGTPYALLVEGRETDLTNTPKSKNISCDLTTVKNLVFQISAPAHKSEQAALSPFKWNFLFEYGDFSLQYTCPFYAVVKNFKTYDDKASTELNAAQQTLYNTLVEDLRDLTLAGGLDNGSRAPEIEEAFNIAKTGNIVVENGKTKTLNKAITITNLTVKPAGKLVVTAPVVVTNDFILEGGLYDGVTHYSMPDAQIQKAVTVAAGHFKLKYTVDFTRFYFVSLPNDVDVANVTMEGEATGVHPLFYKYDSQNRALNGKQNNWKVKSVDGTGTLEAGKGYIFSLEPSSTTATAVFPLDETLISGVNGNNIETSISVEDFDGAGVSVYNKGWNLVGANGRIGAISAIDAALGVVRYVSIPHALDDSYEQLELSDGFEIPAFSSFFVQVEEDNTITFPVSGALAPRRIAEETDERMARITLTARDGDSDHMGVLVTEEATTDYNVGLDLTKMYGSSQKTLCYTLIGANKLAYNALPQVAASNIPVGYKTSLAGEYTFALKENSREGFLHVWLTDTEENTTVDLLEETYVFTTEATTNNTRFLLSCVTDAPTIATDVETVATQSWLATEGHVIHVFGVAENALVSVYDATGRLVEQMYVNGADASFQVSGEGLYVVRVQTNNAMTSLKAMVR